MINVEYPYGMDYLWLASDCNGCLGAFITAGNGPIPERFLTSKHIPIADVESRLRKLKVISKSQLLVSVACPDDFIALANRGLYVYDWTDIGRDSIDWVNAYEQVAIPTKPITVDYLPVKLAALATDIKLTNVNFADSKMLDIKLHLTSVD